MTSPSGDRVLGRIVGIWCVNGEGIITLRGDLQSQKEKKREEGQRKRTERKRTRRIADLREEDVDAKSRVSGLHADCGVGFLVTSPASR